MSVTRGQFFNDPSVTAILDAYAEAALDHLEAGGTETDFPDPGAFLKEHGIDEIPEGPIEVHRTVGHPDHIMRPLCPDGSDGCVPKCRMVHGEWQCVRPVHLRPKPTRRPSGRRCEACGRRWRPSERLLAPEVGHEVEAIEHAFIRRSRAE